MKFAEVVTLLEGVENRPDKDKKRKDFESFFAFLRENNVDPYPVMRLLVPREDRDRGAYGMKDSKLGTEFCKMVTAPRDIVDRVKDWNKNPNQQEDLALILFNYVKKVWVGEGRKWTVEEVNAFLDRLAALYRPSVNTVLGDSDTPAQTQNREAVLREMYMNCCPEEQKWIIRIILGDLRIGVGTTYIVNSYHPDAHRCLNYAQNIEAMCKQLWDRNVKLDAVLQLQLFQGFRPMLLNRCLFNNVPKVMGPEQEFWMEEKVDGHRVIVHVDVEKKECRYFTRDVYDYTQKYGRTPYEKSTRRFWPVMTKHENIRTMILDTELIPYDPATKSFLPASDVIKVAEKDDGIQPGEHLCMVILDLLYLNGTSLTDVYFAKRRETLELAIKPVEGVVQIVKGESGKTTEDVVRYMEEILQDKGEGICVKHPNSLYLPGERVDTWLKLKADYMAGLGEHLDMVIVGGNYGRGSRAGYYSNFLCAVKDDTREDADVWLPVTKFGTGYTYDQMSQLHSQLSHRAIPFNRSNLPDWLPSVDGLYGQDAPDVLFDPRNSLVVELIATQIYPSTTFRIGLSLRFPRFARIREDKSHVSAMTKSQFLAMYEQTKTKEIKLLKNVYNEEGQLIETANAKPQRTQRPSRKNLQIADSYKPADLKGVKRISELFAGIEACVMTGNEKGTLSKQDLEVMLFENGATITQTPVVGSTALVIASRETPKTQTRMRKGDFDLVKPEYVLECVQYSTRLPFEPRFMFFATASTKKKMLETMDEFGDSYTESVDEASLRIILDRMPDQPPLSLEELVEFEEEYGLSGMDHNFLRPVKAKFVPRHPLLEFDVRFHGGRVSDGEDVTHIVVGEGVDVKEVGLDNRRWVVSQKWILDCVAEKSLLPETAYVV